MTNLIEGFLGGLIVAILIHIYRWLVQQKWYRIRFGDYARRERKALPDGTRVRLTCKRENCSYKEHDGIWITSWSPRRTGIIDDPDDYRLTRESDGYTCYSHRDSIEPVKD